MPPKRVVYISGLEAGEVYKVTTKTCEYWLIMTESPKAEVWYRAEGQKQATNMGVVILPARIAEGEGYAIKDLNGKTRTLIIPVNIAVSSIEEIPVHTSA